MNNVYGAFCQRYPDIETVIQSSGMSELEREEFLEKFSADNEHTFVGFCVLGGIYAEGIDLQGNRLIGAIIIGVGLPQINRFKILFVSITTSKTVWGTLLLTGIPA